MNILIFGVSHREAPIQIREKVAFSKTKLSQAYESLSQASFVEEAVILSTCNRSEIIAVVKELQAGEAWFKNFYEDFFKLERGALDPYALCYQGQQAVRYLFRVCCGLDSLVLGEDQILGQVKEAYYQGMEEGTSGKLLNRLFLEAISTAKEVKATTAISSNPLSISSIAVKQAERSLGNLKGKRVLVIGFGKMSRIAMENLLDKGVETIEICCRNQEALQNWAALGPAIQWVPFDLRYERLAQADLVLSATGAPHYVVRQSLFQQAYPGEKPLCLIDIAMPRDIEPAIGELPGVSLYHLDALQEIASESWTFRENCLDQIEERIEAGVEDFTKWVRCMPVYSRIQALQDYSRRLSEEELSLLFKQLPDLTLKDQKQIQQAVKSLVKKMWRKPILQMKQAGQEGRGETLAAAVDELFDLRHLSEE